CLTPFVGATLNVPFATPGTMTAGTHFNAGNVFTAQLSDAGGSFATPVNIGSLTSVALSGSIPAVIPANTASGTGYRIRVVSTTPVSIASSVNVAVGLYAAAPFSSQSIPTTGGSGVTVTATGPNITAYQWGYYTTLGGAITDLAGRTATTYLPDGPDFPGAGTYSVICRMVTSNGCGTVLSSPIVVYVNCPQTGANPNLTVNGDFTAGNVSFTTEYNYVTGPNSMIPEGTYTVGLNPASVHPAFCNMDLPPGRSPVSGGNMLVANAATTGTRIAWGQTIPVTPYKDYVLTFYAANLAGPTNSLFFGIFAGCFRTGADVSVPFQVANCVWSKYSFQLSSGNTTSLDLSIRNISAAAGGNDIAIDDIEFYECVQVSAPPFPVAEAFTWRGTTTDWFNQDNWGSACGPPACINEVTIPLLGPGGVYPVINNNGAAAGTINISSGASLTISAGRNLNVCGDFNNNGVVTADPTSTITFTSNKPPQQLITGNLTGGNRFGNVVVNKTSAADVLQMNVPVDLAGSLTITTGTLDANGQNARVGGNFTNASTFIPGGATVEFNGGANQQFTRTGTGDFYNLIVNKATATNTFTFNPAVTTVANQLTLTRGIAVTTGTNEIRVTNAAAGAVTGYSASSYVNGRLRREISGAQSYDFPVGDASRYELITVNATSPLVSTTNLLGFFNSAAPGGSAPALTESTDVYALTCNPGYWTLTPDAQPTAGNFNLQINPVGIFCTSAVQTIAKRLNSALAWSFGTSTPVSATRRDGFNSFSEVAQVSTDAIPLPVRLVSFDGELEARQIHLHWRTASEKNSAYFEVQRAANGRTFESLGRVAGAGTTQETRRYLFIDQAPLPGLNYYRLRQVDTDGQFHYSRLIEVKADTEDLQREAAVVYPNPVTKGNPVQLRLNSVREQSGQVVTYDGLGRELSRQPIRVHKGPYELMVNSVALLPTGVYL
ncbi:MAG: hypothetical protein H7Z75_13395, partial [Ferruginibacter sp.]|nr:hypothetical protein [Cytophagales bacterium]